MPRLTSDSQGPVLATDTAMRWACAAGASTDRHRQAQTAAPGGRRGGEGPPITTAAIASSSYITPMPDWPEMARAAVTVPAMPLSTPATMYTHTTSCLTLN